jgi:glycosyltransferase involved in cell wall biosynthesis
MRLLLFNLVTDADDPILGFTTRWIAAIAERATSADVITMRAGRIDVPDNVRVHSLGKERGYGEARRAALFYRHLLGILSRQHIDGCFSHMNPLFSVMAGPVLRARRIPLVTWYAHPSLTRTLRLAHRFSNRMVTSLPGAYPYRRDKLTVIGQCIDVSLFAPAAAEAEEDAPAPLVLCAGRLSPVKDHATLLRAVALARTRLPSGLRLVILGQPAGADSSYPQRLRTLAAELGIEELVEFRPGVPMQELVGWYRRATVCVNLTPVGFGDKVAWESMSCGVPTLVANSDFSATLGDCAGDLLFRPGDAEELAGKLLALLARPRAERESIGRYLRSRVKDLHSISALGDKVLHILEDCAGASRGRRSPPLAAGHGGDGWVAPGKSPL